MSCRRGRLLTASVAALAAAAALLFPPDASAFYGFGAQIVSASFERLEQGDDQSSAPAISRDGRYVVFQTRARNLFADDDPDPPGQFRIGGVFRFDLVTRDLERVADGEIRNEAGNSQVSRGALNPSINVDGRYVAFSTGQALVPTDTNENVDVYVRDMSVPAHCAGAICAGAYDLVSASDGGDVPLTYAPSPEAPPGYRLGSEVTPGGAISADGSRVAFRTTEVSDAAGPSTPAFQVLVRARTIDDTELVTRRRSDAGPAGGATGPAGISANGSTIAWTGTNAPAQTEFYNGENTDAGRAYYLWRRPNAPVPRTRRITGAVDPDDPACDDSAPINVTETATGPCYGPLTVPEWTFGGIDGQLPAMSSDGRIVAFVTGAGPRPNTATGTGLDLFVTDMDEGLTRKEATIELTREGSASNAEAAPIEGVVMGSNGQHLALATARTRFVLPTLRFVGQDRPLFGPRELYVVDLAARTIERATRSYSGGDIDSGVAAELSMSSGGERVAFAATASNLFFGDANQRQDAFAISRQAEPGVEEDPPPPSPDAGGQFDEDFGREAGLRLSARRLRNGSIQLRVGVPSAGRVRAVARTRRGTARRSQSRTISRADGRARRAGTVRLVLRPSRRYRWVLRRRRGVAAQVTVTFVPRGTGRRLSGRLPVTFTTKPQRGR